MTHLIWAEISLNALKNNLQVVKLAAPKSNIMAVIKADAYGHGATEVARALSSANSSANSFAVARIDEAIHLRKSGITHPIVVLSGFVSAEEILSCQQYNLDFVLHTYEQFQIVKNISSEIALSIWLKADTGMHRLGFTKNEFNEITTCILKNSQHKLLGAFSHLANAEIIDAPENENQLKQFTDISNENAIKIRSLVNSGGILFHPEMHFEWVRPGIMLYGINPSVNENQFTEQLQPVMTLKARVIHLQTLSAGESVGYNGTWTATKVSTIATVTIGYADGYPRHAPNGTPVLINGKIYPLVGRVSMDLITVDVTGGDVKFFDEVTLWGEGLSANIIAEYAKTIAYDLFTGVTQRVERRYL